MNQYFVAIGGAQQGPFPLHELVARGMRPESLVWREGMGDWQRADAVPELAGLFFAPPPPPAASPPVPPMAYPDQYQRPPQQMGYAQPYAGPRTSGSAITSLILGICSLVPCFSWLVIPCAILAIIFGNVARAATRRGEASGDGMALAGIICGTISLCIIALLIALFLSIGFHAVRFFRF